MKLEGQLALVTGASRGIGAAVVRLGVMRGDAVAFHVAFMALTIFIVVGGVKGGIERASLLMMPTLFVLVIGLALWAATLDGAGAGYLRYLKPELDEILDEREASGDPLARASSGRPIISPATIAGRPRRAGAGSLGKRPLCATRTACPSWCARSGAM